MVLDVTDVLEELFPEISEEERARLALKLEERLAKKRAKREEEMRKKQGQKRAVIYARVSTDDKGQDPQWQINKCREYCEKQGHKIIAEIIDEGVSGTLPLISRPKGKEVIKLIRDGKVDLVVCYSIDRLSREPPHEVSVMLERWRSKYGVKFVSVSEPVFNFEAPGAELIQYALQWFANYYIKQLSDRVKRGIERARARGKRIGRPGAKVDKDVAVMLYQQGYSIRKIAKKMRATPTTVWRRLKEAGVL